MGEKPIKVTWDDIRDPKVDEEVRRQRSLQQSAQPVAPRSASPVRGAPSQKQYGRVPRSKTDISRPIGGAGYLYSAPLYTCVAGAIGAVIGWLLTELTMSQEAAFESYGDVVVHSAIWFAVIGAFVGAAIGAVEGIMSRAPHQALAGGTLGFLAGLLGCALGGAVAQFVYTVMLQDIGPGDNVFARVMLARSVGWGVAGMFLGLGQGVAMKSGEKTVRGLLGGLGGGLVGGLLFDPIARLAESGELCRFVGLLVIGAAAGLLIGLVEELLKEAWLHVVTGTLKGKQFVLYKNPTILGSSAKSDIYLFKDRTVAARHAAIHTIGNRREIEALRTRQPTLVNGQPISRSRLENGDQIRIGRTVFRYAEKGKGRLA